MTAARVPHGPRDRTTVRRALAAGAAVWALAGAVLVVVSLAGGARAAAVPWNLLLAAPFGGMVAVLWIWLANLLDVLAGQPPSRRRWLWGLALTAGVAFVLPLLLRAAFTV